MSSEYYGFTAAENEKKKHYYGSSKVLVNIDCENGKHLTPVQKFYDGANIFITGSTGFLGRVLVEKLLRSCPTVSTLYLLVRNKKGKNLEERLDEMFDDVLFDKLKKENPKFRHKVVGVAGDCSLPELGLSQQDKRILIDEVNIVFHVAATVRFDEKLKTATAINVRSVKDLLDLGREMNNLKSFIHVSTMYSNCVRRYIEEKIYPSPFEGEKLMLLTENLPETFLDDLTPKLLGNFPNTYAYTKQIAEDIVSRNARGIPIGIFRPAIVISTYKEPLVSWINNMYGPTGVVTGAAVGLLRTLHCDSDANANVVPADMTVNSLIISAWEVNENYQKALTEKQPFEIPIYNYESSNDQPITWGKFMDYSSYYGVKYPSVNSIWYYNFSLCKHYSLYVFYTFVYHTIPALLADTALLCMGKKPRLLKAYRKIHKFSNVISYFITQEWKVKSDRIREQQKRISRKDREMFFCDLKKLDWIEYLRTYCRGVRVYLVQDPMDTLDTARVRWRSYTVNDIPIGYSRALFFTRLASNLASSGSFVKKRTDKRKTARDERNTVAVLGRVYLDPHMSIRDIEKESDISHSSVQRILKEIKFRPYKVHLHQSLCPGDYDRRLKFVAWLTVAQEDGILRKILWSDESRFHNNGVVNRHNYHYWAKENPHWVMETNFQNIWGINVWCGIVDGYIIGPKFFDDHLNSERYLEFLVEESNQIK